MNFIKSLEWILQTETELMLDLFDSAKDDILNAVKKSAKIDLLEGNYFDKYLMDSTKYFVKNFKALAPDVTRRTICNLIQEFNTPTELIKYLKITENIKKYV